MGRFGPHIEAEIAFLRTEEGGRKSPAFSGYRPQFFYDDRDWDAEHTYLEVHQVAPGETALANLTFISPHWHRGRVHLGMAFEVREGARIVARGKVTRLLAVEAEIRQLHHVASYYLEEAKRIANDADEDFKKVFRERKMYEFASLFLEPDVVPTTPEDKCIRLVSHVDSAAVRLETTFECLTQEFKDKQVGSYLGERLFEFLRHLVAHRQLYSNKSDTALKMETAIQEMTSEKLLLEYQASHTKLTEYLQKLKLIA